MQFGGISIEEAIEAFRGVQERDNLKRQAALDVGFGYVVIWYHELKGLTSEDLTSRCLAAVSAGPLPKPIDSRKEQQRERQRQFRKEQYSRAKEWRKKHHPNSTRG